MQRKLVPVSIIGFVLIYCGVMLLFTNLFNINTLLLQILSAIFFFLLGIVITGIMLSTKTNNSYMLLPINILFDLSAMLVFAAIIDWAGYRPIWIWTVPLYLLMLATTLWFTTYVFPKHRSHLIPFALLVSFLSLVTLFCTAGFMFVFDTTSRLFMLPLCIICLGGFILLAPISTVSMSERVRNKTTDSSSKAKTEFKKAMQGIRKQWRTYFTDDGIEEAEIVSEQPKEKR